MLRFGFIADLVCGGGVSSKRRGGDRTHLPLKCGKTRDEQRSEYLDTKWSDMSEEPTSTRILTGDDTCDKFRCR